MATGGCMNTHETVLTFACGSETLMGIVSHPGAAATARDIGVVIVVGGPQYRAGSHRQFVLLSRALAAAGFPVLRFDYRGMGDSAGEQRDFEHVSDDIAAAIAALQGAVPEACRVVLWGLCDGASAALLYLHERPDPRVAGLALLNPWVRSEASLAKTQVKHYYVQRLREGAFWRKLFSGKVALGALTGLLRNVRAAFGGTAQGRAGAEAVPYQQRMALAWAAFAGQTLLMLSEHDYTAREFVEFTSASGPWRHALNARPAKRVELAGADHTCSQPSTQLALESSTLEWIVGLR
jgi:exosortase A-associated hydrolase 1